MANSLFNQLNQNQQSMNSGIDIQSLMQSSNPMQTLQQMAQTNPQVAGVLQEIQQSGGDARSLFLQKARQMGINPMSIINQLKK